MINNWDEIKEGDRIYQVKNRRVRELEILKNKRHIYNCETRDELGNIRLDPKAYLGQLYSGTKEEAIRQAKKEIRRKLKEKTREIIRQQHGLSVKITERRCIAKELKALENLK